MSIDKDLVALYRCPETLQTVSVADSILIQRINDAVTRGSLQTKGKKPVSTQLEGGLIREDQRILYPIRENIPDMLIENGIPLDQLTGSLAPSPAPIRD